MSVSPERSPSPHPAALFAFIFLAIFLLHAPLLSLPYFWDEAGYYIPAARDLLLTGSLIPHTTVSNAHPPLILAWLALWWKWAGFAPLVTRSAMLMIAAFSLLGLLRLAQRAANVQVAIASTLCTGLYPVFFAQSSLALVDLAAAGFIFWGLWSYLEDRTWSVALWFSLAALAKETAIVAPAALAGLEGIRLIVSITRLRHSRVTFVMEPPGEGTLQRSGARRTLSLLIPLVPLTTWYAFHYARTGFVFGNPEFFQYNVASTLSLTRFLIVTLLRLWQILGYLHLWVLTLSTLLAMLLPPVKDVGVERPRIASPVLMVFLVIAVAYVFSMAIVGGAVLARYMLPAIPLVIIVGVSTLWRRLSYWPVAIAAVAGAFVAAWFWNPPYGFSPEDNLSYRDYIVLHQDAERFLEARYPMARTLTAWPASDELTRPWLGYITRPMQVVRIEDFSLDEVLSAADLRPNFEATLVFSTKYEPAHTVFSNIEHRKLWEDLKTRFFGFHLDLPPGAVAHILGGHIVFSEKRKGQWVAVIEMERVENARVAAKGVSSLVPH
jgi:hypothetical protein